MNVGRGWKLSLEFKLCSPQSAPDFNSRYSCFWVQSSCVTWHINKLTPSLLPLSSNHGGEWGGTDASAANEEKCVWSNENQFDVVVTLVSVTHRILFWWHTFFALFIIRNVRVGAEPKDFTDTLVLCLVYTWFWMNHLDKQDWMSPHPCDPANKGWQ